MCVKTKILQCNAFNRHRSISYIVFRLCLVCKTSYLSLYIIMKTQDIFKVSTTLKHFMECIVAVIITQDMDMWHMKCQFFISVLFLFNCPLPLCVMLKSYEWWGSHPEKQPNNERVLSLCNTYLLSRSLSYIQLILIYIRLSPIPDPNSPWYPHFRSSGELGLHSSTILMSKIVRLDVYWVALFLKQVNYMPIVS